MEATGVSLARAANSVAAIATKNVVVANKKLANTSGFVALPLRMKAQSRGRTSAKLATNDAPPATTTTKDSRGLIEPDGGVLVDLHVAEAERESKTAEATTLPQISLTKVDLEWVHTVAEGWASPLTGFMRQSEYLQVLHFNCLRLQDGTFVNMSLPIVLAVDDEQKERLSGATAVALVGPNGDDVVAILRK